MLRASCLRIGGRGWRRFHLIGNVQVASAIIMRANSRCRSRPTGERLLFFAMTFASSSAFRMPSRSGETTVAMPPDSSPPIRMSFPSSDRMYLKQCCTRTACVRIWRDASIMPVVLKARTTSPGHFLYSSSHFSRTHCTCANRRSCVFRTAPMRSASHRHQQWHLSFTTASCSRRRVNDRFGIDAGKSGSLPDESQRSECVASKMPARLRPEPYIESMANLKIARRIDRDPRTLKSLDVGGLQIDFFDFRSLLWASFLRQLLFDRLHDRGWPSLRTWLEFHAFQFRVVAGSDMTPRGAEFLEL